MGSNNRYYKMKDKKLTINKKNAKLNKNIAFTLCSIAAIGASSTLFFIGEDANAMMKTKNTKNITSSKITSQSIVKPSGNITTQRMLRGAPGAINSGVLGKDGTPYQGIISSKNTTQVPQSNINPSSSTKPTKLKPPVPPKPSKVSILTHKFNQNKTTPTVIKNGNMLEKTYSQTNNKSSNVITTEGFYRIK